MKNPLLRNIQNLYFYFSIWLFISIIHALILRFNQELIWHWSILDSLVFNALYSAFGLSFWYTCKFISLDKESPTKIVFSHVVAALFASAIWLGLSYKLMAHLSSNEVNYNLFLQSSLAWRLAIGCLFYFVIISFYYVFLYSMNYKEQLLKEAELKALIKDAELKSLKFQINPHFLFNSLNSINSLTISDPRKAGEMTIKLGEYLRYSLSKNEKQKTRLKDELDSVKLYLDIEKVRFGDKIKYDEKVQSSCLDIKVPNMILQPLFENAIKYGVYESLDRVLIKLICKKQDDYLKIVVENNYDPEAVVNKGEGIGLRNIQYRLEKLYNQKNLLLVENSSNLFRVNIFIPIAE